MGNDPVNLVDPSGGGTESPTDWFKKIIENGTTVFKFFEGKGANDVVKGWDWAFEEGPVNLEGFGEGWGDAFGNFTGSLLDNVNVLGARSNSFSYADVSVAKHVSITKMDYNANDNALSSTGKFVGNTLISFWNGLAGTVDAALHPINTIKGVGNGISNAYDYVSTTSFNQMGQDALTKAKDPHFWEDALASAIPVGGVYGKLSSKTKVRGSGRLGNSATRGQINNIATTLESRGYTITGGGGRAAEEFLKPLGGGRKGGSYLDITATHPYYPTLRINTVDVLKNGVTPSARELRNAARIRTQIAPGEHLLLIPKR
jgi:hypothetical protein